MITQEDISSLNDNEIEQEKLYQIKIRSKNDLRLAQKIRKMKKISYLTRNIMIRYRNRLIFDVSKNILQKLFFLH